ncbi:hypothetical protein [Methyloglobulus sp.]|uniref:hypothetical protein n=1 Tax=Methyloglobulus sp. TaxID=2518622 RepID=UPI0032B820CE
MPMWTSWSTWLPSVWAYFPVGTNDYGASWPMLITPGKAEMLVIDQAKTGAWLYRDGTANMLPCGVWEWMLVK